jgi:UDP-N-acetyl-D-galactosamine dehydrogenase
MKKNPIIAVIGLGYVGLPLAVAFANKYKVIGFDIDLNRVKKLQKGIDDTLEISKNSLKQVINVAAKKNYLQITNQTDNITQADVFIVTVPTPTNKYNQPVLTPLITASKTIGKVLKKGGIVIYESTVYPGVTEDICVPILENESGFTFNEDFFVGYSPERINPGDKKHTITKILKVTSGSTPESAIYIDNLYASIIEAGTHLAPSIKVAEAAKVIENSQRDINIAFVNELAKIFNLMDIDTHSVLEAAGTKWNFLPFKPGLVGGHCIGVDPYYLAQKAQEVGYHPEIILAGRRVNDSMGQYVASEIIKLMLQNDIKIKEAKVLVLGITFKENCPDVRNTKSVDVINQLKSYGTDVTIYDPWANSKEVNKRYNLNTVKQFPKSKFDVIVLTVAHNEFLNANLNSSLNSNGILYDVKGVLKENVSGRL